jgi:hypothetical protein
MATEDFILDLDAARRERAHPEGIKLVNGGEEFILPAELPADVFDPFLLGKIDFAGLLRTALENDEENPDLGEILVKVLFENPSLPQDVYAAIHESLALLFGAENYDRFKATRPSFVDLGLLVKGLLTRYGTSLGEVFASPDSSESDGATQKETSDASTSSTPAKSGAAKTAKSKAS